MNLLFVYNADSGLLNALKDTVHKAIATNTYSCNLCRITYPGVTMQADWEKFIKSLPHEVSFLHKDEFHKQYPSQKDIQLPAVFIEKSTGPELLISHTEINKANSVESLIETIKRFLSKQN